MNHHVQGSKEWKEYRKKKIGASDCPVVLGISPYTTPFQLWRRKLGFEEDQLQSSAMSKGHEMEDTIRQLFEKETGHIVFPRVIESAEHPWMMSSLDGMDMDEKLIVEIKYNNRDSHALAKSGSLVDHHYAQVQHQFATCPKVEQAYYVSYNNSDLAIVVVKRDGGFIADMVKKEGSFYKQIVELEPPALMERDWVKKEDAEWSELVSQYRVAQAKAKEMEEIEISLRKQIIEQCGNRNAEGCGLKVTKSFRTGPVQYNMIPELQNVDLNQYRKGPIESWRLTLK